MNNRLKPKAKGETQIPLLVKIQTIDVESLDFRSSVVKNKNKHVTFVEGTSRFLYVGCTSGTVYVFSRESLGFLFIIPFKGGKVCAISATEDESDVAVGSLRGQVSIYRLMTSGSLNNSEATSSAGRMPVSVKHLYSITHHSNNEITEMHWSPNGRYLFTGDNQGLISQVDVGSLNDFPRPPPSRVILQVQSRILQLDCIFPYLAVNTLAGVFLCDIENEDFTRIHTPQRRTVIQATGLCLMVSEEKTEDLSPVSLYVAPQGGDSILRYGMQGNFLETIELGNNYLCPNEVPLFDPKKPTELSKTSENLQEDFRITFGKLYTTDEGYLVSASNHRIVFIDPQGSNIIWWNDDFRRMSSFKVLSNYLFIWETGKLHVVAITYFQSYAQQLLSASVHSVLENWIRHSLNAVGWRQDSEKGDDGDDETTLKESTKVQERFLHLFGSPVIISESDVSTFINPHLPSSIQESLQKSFIEEEEDQVEAILVAAPEAKPKPPADPVVVSINELISKLESICTSEPFFDNLYEILKEFYEAVEVQLPHDVENEDEDNVIFKQSLFQSKMTLENLVQSCGSFLKQESLQRINLKLQEPDVDFEVDKFRNILTTIIANLSFREADCLSSDSLFFVNYGKQNYVKRWLTDFKVTPNLIKADTYLAELYLLLIPLIKWTSSHDLKELMSAHRKRLFTWLVILVSCKEYKVFPFVPRLGDFLTAKMRGNAINDVISCVYEDLQRPPEEQQAIYFIHHFATLLYLKAMSKASKSKILTSLVTNFPPKNRTEGETRTLLLHHILKSNRMLVEMYMEACLTDGNSQGLCKCGLPEFYGIPRLFMIPKTQRLIEETILEILMRREHSSNNILRTPELRSESENETSDNNIRPDIASELVVSRGKRIKPAFKFAMKRLLLDKYFEMLLTLENQQLLDDSLQIEIILRSGECHLLQKYFQFNMKRLQLVIEFYSKIPSPDNLKKIRDIVCVGCKHSLRILPNYRLISWDCLGLWILGDETLTENERLTRVIQSVQCLNTPGKFSLTFYKFLAQSSQEEAFDEDSIGVESVRSYQAKLDTRSVCAAFH